MIRTVPSDEVYFRPVSPSDLEAVLSLEVQSYPEDEAADRHKLETRVEQAAGVFLVAVRHEGGEEQLVGFVNGSCTTAGKLTHESMSTHQEEGGMLCIHSVCVRVDLRRKGLATRMLKAYLQYVRMTSPHLYRIRLLTKQQLVSLYQKSGFSLLGPSDVVHGQEQWYEMSLDIDVSGTCDVLPVPDS